MVRVRRRISVAKSLRRAYGWRSGEQCQRWVPNWQTQRSPGAQAAQGLAPSQGLEVPRFLPLPLGGSAGRCSAAQTGIHRLTLWSQPGLRDNEPPARSPRPRGSNGPAGRSSLPCALTARLLGSHAKVKTQGCGPVGFWATALDSSLTCRGRCITRTSLNCVTWAGPDPTPAQFILLYFSACSRHS